MVNLKEWLIIFLIITIGVASGIAINGKLNQTVNIGQNSTINPRPMTLMGDSTDSERAPQSYVKADTTSTDTTYDGGYVIQKVQTDYNKKLVLNVAGVGSVSTSTLFIRYQVSDDGTNFFDVTMASTTDNIARTLATSTPDSVPLVDSVLLGAASTTKSFLVNIPPAAYTRFLFYGPKAGHLNLGVQAWIRLWVLENIK